MKKGIKKAISTIAILTMTFQIGMPMIPGLQTTVLATDTTNLVEEVQENIQPIADKSGTTELSANIDTTETEEISRNYEIKDEETWDVSANGDGSVIAKWTLENRTLTISGTGKMKEWSFNIKEDWHNTQYTNFIEKVIINEGITSIGDWAFAYCSNLESINIPEGVTSIGERAFYGCSSLTNIDVDIDNQNYISENGILLNKEKTEIICYPAGKKDIKKYIIPEGVTIIAEYAFSECSSLESIVIPNSVTSIVDNAFSRCSSLNSINIPEGVTSIGYSAFSGCSNLESITIPSSVTTIEGRTFLKCSSLESIEISDSVTSIGGYAFYGCSSLTNIVQLIFHLYIQS